MKCTLELDLEMYKAKAESIERNMGELNWMIEKIERVPPRDFVFNYQRFVQLARILKSISESCAEIEGDISKQFVREPFKEGRHDEEE